MKIRIFAMAAALWMLSPLAGLAETPNPTLYLIGDSTVRNGRGDGANGQWGWGDLISRYFDLDKIHVVNRALGGRSSRTFLTEGHWDEVLARLKPGDFVLMQFGHNDAGPLDDTSRARGTLPGTGEDTRNIDNPLTKRRETVHTYGWYLRQYIAGARAQKALPIVCSLVPRMTWQDGKIARSSETYARWAGEVARQEGVPFLDLNEIIATRYDELGAARVKPLFHGDRTHTSLEGADLNAASVIAGLTALPADPLAVFFLQERRISANRYGAKGDGQSLDTAAIQAALDAAAKVGGTVVFSPGVYLTGSLFLKSGTHFRVDSGVEIRGVPELSAYPILPTRVAGIEMKWPAALINVYEQSDIQISGDGAIDGDGKIWWDKYRAMRAEYDPKGLRWAADYDCQRPRLIQIYKSTNVRVRGLTLKRSGFWTVHICYSTKVTVDGVTIRNNIGGRGPSTDGIDVDSSSGILIQNADVECNDDAVVLKAGRDADGLRVNRPTEDVTVRDITVRSGAAGITFGSETSGGIRHVEAYRIHVAGTVPNGILFKSAQTRGGTIEDIAIHDIDVRGVKTVFTVTFNWNPNYSYARIPAGVSNMPDYWRVLAEPVPAEKGLPHLRNVRISDLRAVESQQAFAVASYADSPLQNVTFTNIDIQAESGGTIRNAANWKFVNSRIQTADGRGVTVEESRDITGLAAGAKRQFDLRAGAKYSDRLGYGFEQDPRYFSIRVPEEGNYRVTVTLGDPARPAVTTVMAELRRLMLENIETKAGEFQTRSFLVNVRRPPIADDDEVRLREREKSSEARAWDDRLSLEFAGPHPAVRAVEIEKAADVPTLFIIGDSTSTDQPEEPFRSWGQVLTRFFKPEIAVANHGESGESLHSFIAEQRLAKVMSLVRPGDFLLVQMGHNDQKEKGEGVGAFTSYKTYLKQIIAQTREHGAMPILVTPMNRVTFGPDGKIVNSLGDYPAAVREAAKEEGVALLDLHAMSAVLYEAWGPENAPKAFAPNDATHSNDYGSYEFARCIVEAIRREHLPLARFLLDVPPFDPRHPDDYRVAR